MTIERTLGILKNHWHILQNCWHILLARYFSIVMLLRALIMKASWRVNTRRKPLTYFNKLSAYAFVWFAGQKLRNSPQPAYTSLHDSTWCFSRRHGNGYRLSLRRAAGDEYPRKIHQNRQWSSKYTARMKFLRKWSEVNFARSRLWC